MFYCLTSPVNLLQIIIKPCYQVLMFVGFSRMVTVEPFDLAYQGVVAIGS